MMPECFVRPGDAGSWPTPLSSAFLVVMLGAAAMTDALGHLGVSVVWIGAGVAAIGASQLVFDFAGPGA